MIHWKTGIRAIGALVTLAISGVAPAGGFDSGSDGSDGAFAPVGNVEIDLSLAVTGAWNTPGNGNGVYDQDRWMVVFKYTTISIPPGVTVSFYNHPSAAPVVWLAQGDVAISGTVQVNGESGTFSLEPYTYATPGPGGFHGGSAQVTGFSASGGFGPGGGGPHAAGNYSGFYGNAGIFPLIGGSGGGGSIASQNNTGGAGGGAILVASSGTITHSGLIEANGGPGFINSAGGSGGGIRLVANTIIGTGSITAVGGAAQSSPGGPGRIRLEAFDATGFTGATNPLGTIAGPGPLVQTSTTPTVRVTLVDGQPVPQDPIAGILTKEVVTEDSSVVLTIQATNVPPGTTVSVEIRPAHGSPNFVNSTPLVGSLAFTTATAVVALPAFPAEIQLRASF